MATKKNAQETPPITDEELMDKLNPPSGGGALENVPYVTLGMTITRKYGNVEVTLHKEIFAAVATLHDQHREYDKLAQQLEWHHQRIANERAIKGRADGGNPPK